MYIPQGAGALARFIDRMENENGTLPQGLKELSSVAVKKQVHVNEAIENHHHICSQFLRVFNAGIYDVEMIVQRAEAVVEAAKQVINVVETITKKSLD